MQKTIATYGKLDCAFNNAGVEPPAKPLHEQFLEDFDKLISINVRGLFVCMKYEIQQMLTQGSGVIISSIGGLSVRLVRSLMHFLMESQQSTVVFDQERAAAYDDQFAKLAPMRDALHFLIRIVLSELPDDARILCVGVGTGLELIDLAQNFPQWQFTVVEPAAPMLNICRQKAKERGIISRCTFHEGYLNSLPTSDAFHAATCLLVSHFFMQPEERRNFFRQIGARLRPNGYLISADLAFDMSTPAYKSLVKVWQRAFQYAEIPAEEIETLITSLGRTAAVLPPQEVESIIASSGFDTPVLFLQTLLIHAWYSKRAA